MQHPQNQRRSLKRPKRSNYPPGTYFDKNSGKIKAQIMLNKIYTHLGLFDTVEEAFNKYKNEYKKHYGKELFL